MPMIREHATLTQRCNQLGAKELISIHNYTAVVQSPSFSDETF
jgi:hypothetical protein